MENKKLNKHVRTFFLVEKTTDTIVAAAKAMIVICNDRKT